jgi:hypothetical protein
MVEKGGGSRERCAWRAVRTGRRAGGQAGDMPVIDSSSAFSGSACRTTARVYCSVPLLRFPLLWLVCRQRRGHTTTGKVWAAAICWMLGREQHAAD